MLQSDVNIDMDSHFLKPEWITVITLQYPPCQSGDHRVFEELKDNVSFTLCS